MAKTSYMNLAKGAVVGPLFVPFCDACGQQVYGAAELFNDLKTGFTALQRLFAPRGGAKGR